jgi:hypothetical protein
MMKLKITTEIDIPQERIASEICTAMEQGSGYWARVTRESKDDRDDYLSPHPRALPYFKYFHNGWTEFGEIDESTGRLGPKRYMLKLDTIKRGIQTMAEKYPNHYAGFMSESGDCITADVFLQCCLFGEIVYG